MEEVLLVVTGTLTAMLAGFFFGYAVSIVGGLHRLTDSEYVRAMQSINKVILNPLFFTIFLGPVILLPWAAFIHLGNDMAFILLLIASLAYIVGTFGVTIAGNVPLNDKLAALDSSKASPAEFAKARRLYEKSWNRLHIIRTVAGVVSVVLVFIACLYR